jgi:DNA-binding transcriptional ArsR family regulator
MTAATVAEQSLTSEQTARKHLRSLVEHGYVTKTASPESKATLYRRANDSLAVEQARRIMDETDAEALSTRVLENQERLRDTVSGSAQTRLMRLSERCGYRLKDTLGMANDAAESRICERSALHCQR